MIVGNKSYTIFVKQNAGSGLKLNKMTTSIQTNENNNGLLNLEPNSVYFAFSNHYRGNSCGSFILTNLNGEEMHNCIKPHWHNNYEDRGVLKLVKFDIKEKNQLEIYINLKWVCNGYVQASTELKNFKANTEKFEDTYWFKKRATKVKKETVERKKNEFYQNQKKNNASRFEILLNEKLTAKGKLEDINLSSASAYLFFN